MPGHNRKPMEKPKHARETLLRVLGYMKPYRLQLTIAVLALVIQSVAGVLATYYLKPLLNDGLLPFIGQKNPDLTPLVRTLVKIGVIYAIGAGGNFLCNKLLVKIGSGTLFAIRKDLFARMEKLPLRYFDSHPHGELMSRFTNDTDTLRELIGNVLPNLISNSISVVGVLVMMIILSPLLTVIVCVMFAVMLLVVTVLGKKAGRYFKEQQMALGKVNGYIEEMIGGQKVVKVFCHEDQIGAGFDEVNGTLAKAATGANTCGSILMPIMGNLNYLLYAIVTMAGGAFAILGWTDVGTIAAYLQYTRNFSMPITQLSQLFTNVMTGLAGAERIFQVIDEAPEEDEGHITLVNIEKRLEPDGSYTLHNARGVNTGIWEWKVPADLYEPWIQEEMKEGRIKADFAKGH